jgi:AAA+ ATPase superfamily predicted ATPase
MDEFVDRVTELAELDSPVRHRGFVVVFGRRRIGKTKLIGEWLRRRGGLYSQAI